AVAVEATGGDAFHVRRHRCDLRGGRERSVAVAEESGHTGSAGGLDELGQVIQPVIVEIAHGEVTEALSRRRRDGLAELGERPVADTARAVAEEDEDLVAVLYGHVLDGVVVELAQTHRSGSGDGTDLREGAVAVAQENVIIAAATG